MATRRFCIPDAAIIIGLLQTRSEADRPLADRILECVKSKATVFRGTHGEAIVIDLDLTDQEVETIDQELECFAEVNEALAEVHRVAAEVCRLHGL
jgi:hypothetical protein